MYIKGDNDIKHIDERHSIRLLEVNNVIDNLIDLNRSLGESVKLRIEKKDKYLIVKR